MKMSESAKRVSVRKKVFGLCTLDTLTVPLHTRYKITLRTLTLLCTNSSAATSSLQNSRNMSHHSLCSLPLFCTVYPLQYPYMLCTGLKNNTKYKIPARPPPGHIKRMGWCALNRKDRPEWQDRPFSTPWSSNLIKISSLFAYLSLLQQLFCKNRQITTSGPW